MKVETFTPANVMKPIGPYMTMNLTAVTKD